jgi:hypothetical protein
VNDAEPIGLKGREVRRLVFLALAANELGLRALDIGPLELALGKSKLERA